MKIAFAPILLVAALAGCASVPIDPARLRQRADTVQIDLQLNHALWVGENRDPAFIDKLTAFAGSFPDNWIHPPRTPSAAFKIVLFFRSHGEIVSSLGVGYHYFSREDSDWQPLSRAKADELSAILGFDVWAFILQSPSDARWN